MIQSLTRSEGLTGTEPRSRRRIPFRKPVSISVDLPSPMRMMRDPVGVREPIQGLDVCRCGNHASRRVPKLSRSRGDSPSLSLPREQSCTIRGLVRFVKLADRTWLFAKSSQTLWRRHYSRPQSVALVPEHSAPTFSPVPPARADLPIRCH